MTELSPLSRGMDGLSSARVAATSACISMHLPAKTLKLTVPMHKPLKRSTLSRILKQAYMTVEDLNDLL